ncbi:MAG: restriction endonuclease subunit S [Methylobacter sp.]
MDAQQFLAEFGHIAGAPGGVQRVRELILQLAISGDLTQRVERDTPASVLFEHNQNALTRHFVDKKMKRPHPTSAFGVKDVPWRLPEGWVWCRLGQVTNYGQAPKSDYADVADDTWVLELEDIEKISSKLIQRVRAKDRKFQSTKNGFPSGAVLYGKLRPYLDKVLIADERGVCTTEIIPISFFHGIDAAYLRWYLKSPYFVSYASNSTHGMNLPRMGTDAAREAFFPFPPKQEQARIVAKVDELMALCDKLEVQLEEQTKIETSARKATLQELVSADIVSLSPSLARLDQNLHALFKTPDSIDDFLASLKELAVRGLLTANTGVFPDVSEIKTACAAQRAEYISAGWTRKQKIVLAPDSTVDYPPNWAVIPFDDVALVIGGVTKGRDLRGRDVMTCPYLSVANVQRGFFKLENVKTIQIAEGELGKYRVQDGDLLITEGGDWDKVGRTAIWHGGIENCLHQNHVFKARVPSDQLLNEWVELVFNSNIGRDYFAGASKQTTNLASINMTQLRSFPLPIPPLVEQKAILDKLATLSEICRTWRDQLVQARKLASLLAVSSVALITGIRNEEEEALKTPKTELISKLRLANNPDIKEQAPLAAILARHHDEMPANDLWQRYGGDIDAFYAQLKLEVGKGWIEEPAIAEMREVEAG